MSGFDWLANHDDFISTYYGVANRLAAQAAQQNRLAAQAAQAAQQNRQAAITASAKLIAGREAAINDAERTRKWVVGGIVLTSLLYLGNKKIQG